MTARTDADIIRQSLNDPQAFGEIFSRHLDAVHAYLVRRAGRGIADDLAGEVFRIAFERRRAFHLDRSSARPWLYGVAANILRRHQRDRWRRIRAHRRFQLREPTTSEDSSDTAAAVSELSSLVVGSRSWKRRWARIRRQRSRWWRRRMLAATPYSHGRAEDRSRWKARRPSKAIRNTSPARSSAMSRPTRRTR